MGGLPGKGSLKGSLLCEEEIRGRGCHPEEKVPESLER